MFTTTLIIVGFVILMLPGLFFAVLGLPGAPYIFIVCLLYAFADRLHHLTGHQLVALGVIAAISILTDQLAGLIGSRWGGARGVSLLYGIIGLIVGNIVLPLLGGLIGLFLGITIGEIIRRRRHPGSVDIVGESVRAGLGGIIGTVTGIVIHVCLAIIMIGLFVFCVI